MRSLIKTIFIMAILVVIGMAASVYLYVNLINQVSAARERGSEEGYNQGYQAGIEDGGRTGYQGGSQLGYIRSTDGNSGGGNETGFYFTYNPTSAGLREMLAERQQTLADNETDFASKLHDYAEANGIRTAYVRCTIAREAPEGMVYLYELVAFDTTDKGLIIIEPQQHKETRIEVGRGYNELNGFPIPDYDDTITKITIVW